MRVLVTGSTGFVGQHVVTELAMRGHSLVLARREDLDLVSMQMFNEGAVCHNGAYAFQSWLSDTEFEFGKIDAIVHLAGTCGGIGINKDNPGKFIYENLQMGINVLEGARLAKIPKVVNLGTVCSYPKYTPTPFQEDTLWDGYPEETNAPYGIAKKTIMEMGIAYSRQYGMNITNLVPVNMAGEWDNFDPYSSHVIPALIRKFEEAKGAPVTLWGTGSASREFLYAGDCAKAIAIALETNTGPEPINLGSGREVTIKVLAELVKRVGGYTSDISWDSSKPDGQPRRCLSITRARDVLAWVATTSLEDMLKKTIEWYRTNG